jgi:hypothetical protein
VKPSCFVLPSNAIDVSIAIKALNGPIPDNIDSPKEESYGANGGRPAHGSGWGGWLFGGLGSKIIGGVTGGGPRWSRTSGGYAGAGSKPQPKQASEPKQSNEDTCKFAIRSGGLVKKLLSSEGSSANEV